jgi:hypothetical protein
MERETKTTKQNIQHYYRQVRSDFTVKVKSRKKGEKRRQKRSEEGRRKEKKNGITNHNSASRTRRSHQDEQKI